ncbi:MAG TPA: metal-dependent hydrolase [Mycobacteriales bacterium]|nr:metal-dependent hydrolase [Mycobacteriales bacterium]
MLGHSHATSGALGWSLLAPTVLSRLTDVRLRPGEVLAGTVLCAGAALLPDLDHPEGTIAHFLGPVSRLLTRVVNFVSGGHRHGTHSFLFAGLMGVGTWAGERYLGRYFVLAMVFVLLGLASRALHLCPPGEGIHSWGVVVVESAVGTLVVDRWIPNLPDWMPYLVAAGCLIHLVGDCLTERGCPLLWPVGHRFGIPMISHTGNRLETLLLTPAMAAGAVVALWFLLRNPTGLV